MKQVFCHHYALTDTEFKELWNSAIFSFDANVLLNFYRYSQATITKFSEVITKLGDRTWLPYQAATEFYKRRFEVITKEEKTYKEKSATIAQLLKDFSNEDRSPFLSALLFEEFSCVVQKVIEELDTKRVSFDKLLTDDKLLGHVGELFDQKIGQAFEMDRLQTIYSQGQDRYEKNTPPGFADMQKPEPDRYGDLVLWHQMLEKSKASNKPMVFVTDDRKQDWWLEVSGKTLGPLPALREEFFEATQQQFHIYRPFQFLEYANIYLKTSVAEDILEEVKVLPPISQTPKSLKDVIMSLTVDRSNPSSDVDGFVKLLKGHGYEVSNAEISTDRVWIFITVPNIPDLQRRVHDRFLTGMEKFGLKLINLGTNYDERV